MRRLYDLGYTYQEIADYLGRSSKGSIYVQCAGWPERKRMTISFDADLHADIEAEARKRGLYRNELILKAVKKFLETGQ